MLTVSGKGKLMPAQSISLDEVFQVGERDGVLVHAAGLYDYQGTINVGEVDAQWVRSRRKRGGGTRS